jgi:hypothetical protein
MESKYATTDVANLDMGTLMALVHEDATKVVPSDGDLTRVATLARTLKHYKDALAQLEARVSAGKQMIKQIEETDLPDAMTACGIETFTLDDGSKIEANQMVVGSIPESRRDEALAWLREHGHGDLIKGQLTVLVPREKSEMSAEVIQQLKDMGLEVESKETVHPQTLQKWAREMLADGEDIPASLLGLYVGRRAKLTAPKK